MGMPVRCCRQRRWLSNWAGSTISATARRLSTWAISVGTGTPGTKGTLATFQPRMERYMLSGVLPTRETPVNTISAWGRSSRRLPSSWATAYSMAATRSK
ncbi:MAG: hypothetical protein R2851_06715 [Caldilineaceae bacterium]